VTAILCFSHTLCISGFMKQKTVTECRREFAAILNTVEYAGERIIVTEHGRPVAAIISMEDLKLLEMAAGPLFEMRTGPSAASSSNSRT